MSTPRTNLKRLELDDTGDHLRHAPRHQRIRAILAAFPMEDRRGKHSLLQNERDHEQRRAQGLYSADERHGLLVCECVARGADRPRVLVPEYGDSAPVCTGCGLVLGDQLLVHDDFTGEEYDGPGQLGRRARGTTPLNARGTFSAPYKPEVHFAEFMALITLTGPTIPDDDLVAIGEAYNRHERLRNEDPLFMCCSDVRLLLRESVSKLMQRRYAERWLQILRYLSDPEYFETEGPPIIGRTVAHDMKRRFGRFIAVYKTMRDSGNPLFAGRSNVPYLCTVGRGLLYQTCMTLEPDWATRHREWLEDSEDRAWWEREVLGAWRVEYFLRHSWVFRWLKSPASQLANELMTALCIEALRKQETNQVLSWVEHPCLLPARPLSEWSKVLERLLTSPRRSGSRSRGRSRSLPSGASRSRSGATFTTSASWKSTAAGWASSPTSGTSSSSPSLWSYDTLGSTCLELLGRSYPTNAHGFNARSWEEITAIDLRRLARQSRKPSRRET